MKSRKVQQVRSGLQKGEGDATRIGMKCITEEFLGHLLHDLKTPVVTIQGYAKRLHEGKSGALNDEQKEALGIIINSSERLEQDLKMILEYSKSVGPDARIAVELFDVTKVVATLVDNFKPLAQQRGIRLQAKVPGQPLMIQADWRMIDRTISNLIDNALKYTDSGGWVVVELSSTKHVIEMRVSDSGKGLDKNKLNLIFKPFEQVMDIEDREVRGVGLGLANVKRYVELHRGEIQVESEIGKGSTFTIRLPHRQNPNSKSQSA